MKSILKLKREENGLSIKIQIEFCFDYFNPHMVLFFNFVYNSLLNLLNILGSSISPHQNLLLHNNYVDTR